MCIIHLMKTVKKLYPLFIVLILSVTLGCGGEDPGEGEDPATSISASEKLRIYFRGPCDESFFNLYYEPSVGMDESGKRSVQYQCKSTFKELQSCHMTAFLTDSNQNPKKNATITVTTGSFFPEDDFVPVTYLTDKNGQDDFDILFERLCGYGKFGGRSNYTLIEGPTNNDNASSAVIRFSAPDDGF